MTCPLQSPFASFGLVLMENIHLMLKSRFNCSAAAQTHRQVPLSNLNGGIFLQIVSRGHYQSYFSAHKGLKAQRVIVQHLQDAAREQKKSRAEALTFFSFLSIHSMFLLNFCKTSKFIICYQFARVVTQKNNLVPVLYVQKQHKCFQNIYRHTSTILGFFFGLLEFLCS